MKPLFVFYLLGFSLLTSCTGQGNTNPPSSGGCHPDSSFEKRTHHVPKVDSYLYFSKGVASIFQDSKGNIWYGSHNEGVCRFDGKTYTYYTSGQGLPQNQILDIREDSQGNIWFNGQCYYNGQVFTTLRETGQWNALMDKSRRTPSSAIWKLSDDDLWFSVPNDGVLRYDGELNYLAFPVSKEDSLYYKENIHLPYFVMTLLKDRQGKMWFGTYSRGVIGYDGKDLSYFNPDHFGKNGIRSVFQDKSGDLWFGSDGAGLYRYDGSAYHNFISGPAPNALARVWAINQDAKGDLWFGTRDQGIWRYDGKNWTHFTLKDGLPNLALVNIYKDPGGKLWFITQGGEVYTFNGKAFEVFYDNC